MDVAEDLASSVHELEIDVPVAAELRRIDSGNRPGANKNIFSPHTGVFPEERLHPVREEHVLSGQPRIVPEELVYLRARLRPGLRQFGAHEVLHLLVDRPHLVHDPPRGVLVDAPVDLLQRLVQFRPEGRGHARIVGERHGGLVLLQLQGELAKLFLFRGCLQFVDELLAVRDAFLRVSFRGLPRLRTGEVASCGSGLRRGAVPPKAPLLRQLLPRPGGEVADLPLLHSRKPGEAIHRRRAHPGRSLGELREHGLPRLGVHQIGDALGTEFHHPVDRAAQSEHHRRALRRHGLTGERLPGDDREHVHRRADVGQRPERLLRQLLIRLDLRHHGVGGQAERFVELAQRFTARLQALVDHLRIAGGQQAEIPCAGAVLHGFAPALVRLDVVRRRLGHGGQPERLQERRQLVGVLQPPRPPDQGVLETFKRRGVDAPVAQMLQKLLHHFVVLFRPRLGQVELLQPVGELELHIDVRPVGAVPVFLDGFHGHAAARIALQPRRWREGRARVGVGGVERFQGALVHRVLLGSVRIALRLHPRFEIQRLRFFVQPVESVEEVGFGEELLSGNLLVVGFVADVLAALFLDLDLLGFQRLFLFKIAARVEPRVVVLVLLGRQQEVGGPRHIDGSHIGNVDRPGILRRLRLLIIPSGQRTVFRTLRPLMIRRRPALGGHSHELLYLVEKGVDLFVPAGNLRHLGRRFISWLLLLMRFRHFRRFRRYLRRILFVLFWGVLLRCALPGGGHVRGERPFRSLRVEQPDFDVVFPEAQRNTLLRRPLRHAHRRPRPLIHSVRRRGHVRFAAHLQRRVPLVESAAGYRLQNLSVGKRGLHDDLCRRLRDVAAAVERTDRDHALARLDHSLCREHAVRFALKPRPEPLVDFCLDARHADVVHRVRLDLQNRSVELRAVGWLQQIERRPLVVAAHLGPDVRRVLRAVIRVQRELQAVFARR